MSMTMAARSSADPTLSAPARRAAAYRRKPSRLGRLLLAMWRRPGRALMLLLFSGAAAAIAVNALMFQTARHPAPMLQQAPVATAPAAAPAPVPATGTVRQALPLPAAEPVNSQSQAVPASTPSEPARAGLPPVRPGDLGRANPGGQRPPATVQRSNVTAAAAPAKPAAARDPIADLINGDLRPPADIRGAKPARREN